VPHLVANSALVLENCGQSPCNEVALFHLINAMEERGGTVLLTGRHNLSGWEIKTPDLLSRLRRATLIEIEHPDDALLGALLVKLLLDRQMIIDTSIVEFIRQRIGRSVESVQTFVEAIDREGLARGRRITRGLVSDCLRQAEIDSFEG
jgi:chromosomal replication initiation ATPase DnaA